MSKRDIKEWYKFAFRLLVNDQWHVIAERVQNGDQTYRWVKEQLLLALHGLEKDGSQWVGDAAFKLRLRLKSFKNSTITEENFNDAKYGLGQPGGKFVLQDRNCSAENRLRGARLALVECVLVNYDEPTKAGHEICVVFEKIIEIEAVYFAIYEKKDAKLAYEVKVMYDLAKEYAKNNKLPIDDLIELEFDPSCLPSETSPVFKPRETWVFGDFGHGNGQLYYPQRVHVDKEGNYLVMDEQPEGDSPQRIQLFSPLGKFMKVIVQSGEENGIREMRDFCLNKSGNLVVADIDYQGNGRVHVFDYDGNQLNLINIDKDELLDNPDDKPRVLNIFIDEDDNIICADNGLTCVWVFSSDGKVKARFGKWGRPDGCFGGLSRLAANDGKIYVYDSHFGNPRTQVFDYNGTFIDSIWLGYEYKWLVFHTDGHIYAVVDDHIDRLDLEGNHEVVAGGKDEPLLESFFNLSSIAFLPDGRLAAADGGYHRIKVFNLKGGLQE